MSKHTPCPACIDGFPLEFDLAPCCGRTRHTPIEGIAAERDRLRGTVAELLEAAESVVYADSPEHPISADDLAHRCHMTFGAAERMIAAIAKAKP